MHRHLREHLEEVLAEPDPGKTSGTAGQHLGECGECRAELNQMREQAALLRVWRAPEEKDPKPGFYARVLERIEAEGPASIWSLFFESSIGRRLAIASLALAVLLCAGLVSWDRFFSDTAQEYQPFASELRGQVVAGEDQPGVVLTGAPDQDSVLVNLVTYREQ